MRESLCAGCHTRSRAQYHTLLPTFFIILRRPEQYALAGSSWLFWSKISVVREKTPLVAQLLILQSFFFLTRALFYFLLLLFFGVTTSAPTRRTSAADPAWMLKTKRPQHLDLLATMPSVPYNHAVSPDTVFFHPALPLPAAAKKSHKCFVWAPVLAVAFVSCNCSLSRTHLHNNSLNFYFSTVNVFYRYKNSRE